MMIREPFPPTERQRGLWVQRSGRHHWHFHLDGSYRGSLRWAKNSGRAVWRGRDGFRVEFFRRTAKQALERGCEWVRGEITLRPKVDW